MSEVPMLGPSVVLFPMSEAAMYPCAARQDPVTADALIALAAVKPHRPYKALLTIVFSCSGFSKER